MEKPELQFLNIETHINMKADKFERIAAIICLRELDSIMYQTLLYLVTVSDEVHLGLRKAK